MTRSSPKCCCGPTPIMTLLDHPKVQAVIQNPDLVQLIWSTVVPDLKDVSTYLVTAKSAKYDSEKILGRWNFNLNVTMSLFRRAKPNISSKEMLQWKRWMLAAFRQDQPGGDDRSPGHSQERAPIEAADGWRRAAGGPQTLKGQWKDLDGKYQLALSGGSRDELLTATIEGDRLTIAGGGMGLVFDRED